MRTWIVVVLGMLLLGSPAEAARSGPSLQNILARLTALEKENATLRSRVAKLESDQDTHPTLASAQQQDATTAPRLAQVEQPAQSSPHAANTDVEDGQNWNGFYAGVASGVVTDNTTWQTISIFNPPFIAAPAAPQIVRAPFGRQAYDKTRGGLAIVGGYNVQLASPWLVGVEGQLALDNTVSRVGPEFPGTGGSSAVILPSAGFDDSASIHRGVNGNILARLGVLVSPDVLIYGSGGLAAQHVRVDATCGPSFATSQVCIFGPHNETVSQTMTGWSAGIGLEAAINNGFLARFEYRYNDYGTLRHNFFANPAGDGNLRVAIPLQSASYTVGLIHGF